MSDFEEDSLYHPSDYDMEFNGEAYLEHLYGSEAMSQGNRISLFVLPNFAEVIRKTTPENKRLTLVDIGSGPTIYSALCFRNVVSKVYLADYLESNLSLLIEWLENRQNFDWIPVIRRVAKNEGCITTPDLIAKIEEETRRVVKNGSILHANVHNAEVLGANQNINSSQQFDILVSIFCLESACSTLTEYKNALKNMIKLLRPGGTIILGSVVEMENYISGVIKNRPKLFSLLYLSEKQIVTTLEEVGINVDNMTRAGLPQQNVLFIMAKRSI